MSIFYDDRLRDLPGFPPSRKGFVKPRLDTRHQKVVEKIIDGADVRIDYENRKGWFVKVGAQPGSGYFDGRPAAEDYMALLMKDAGK